MEAIIGDACRGAESIAVPPLGAAWQLMGSATGAVSSASSRGGLLKL